MVKKLSKYELKRRAFILRNRNILGYLYPNTIKIYGPYLGKDDRYRVVFYDGKNRKTRQYAKVKMEIKLERRIEDPETVDHRNNNSRDDRYENLRCLFRSDHSADDVLRVKLAEQKCVWCGAIFLAKPRYSKTKSGPFCSRPCSGKYGVAIQNNRIHKINRVNYKKEYYRRKNG